MAPSAVKLLMENLWRESQVLPSKLECERNLLEGDDRNEVKQLFPDPRARVGFHLWKAGEQLWVVWVQRLGIPRCLSIWRNVEASTWLMQEEVLS
ncbi:Hypothetical predicted protein [Lynx pardinus]|uniref:Uncharacterized protein n=1 Tax=Lynx pardinus TaxID=191816 RepID=A0A485MEJ2_LYNPA|nr:Hypothetical predicted protein [Lynx pardinus]